MHPSSAPSATVAVTPTELDVTLANGAVAALPVTMAGATVVDPEATALANGGEVITWIEAFSHSLQAHYAVLDSSGHVVADAAYGAGYSTSFEAVALKGGGFVIADAESDLFGTHAMLTAQNMDSAGAASGASVVVASGTSATGGLYYSDLEGASSGHGAAITWDDPSGAHMAYVGGDGSVQTASTHDLSHAMAHHSDWFVLG